MALEVAPRAAAAALQPLPVAAGVQWAGPAPPHRVEKAARPARLTGAWMPRARSTRQAVSASRAPAAQFAPDGAARETARPAARSPPASMRSQRARSSVGYSEGYPCWARPHWSQPRLTSHRLGLLPRQAKWRAPSAVAWSLSRKASARHSATMGRPAAQPAPRAAHWFDPPPANWSVASSPRHLVGSVWQARWTD